MPGEASAAAREVARLPRESTFQPGPGQAVDPAPAASLEPIVLSRLLAGADSAALSSVLAHVQRTAGNRTVQRMLASYAVQRCTETTICAGCAAEGVGADVQVQGDFLGSAKDLGAAALRGLSAQGQALVQLLSCTAPARAAALVGAVEPTVQGMLLGHIKSGTFPNAAEAQILVPVVEKAIIDGMCHCLPDRVITAIALHVYLVGQPLAQRHLQHYLTGGGADFKEDINDLFARNPTVTNNVASQIGEQSDGGKIKSGVLQGGGDLPGGRQLPGFPPITQDDYDDQDWRNSIGNVDRLDWTIVAVPDAAGNATVRITLADPYAWHPKEARMTQCVHQAIENMKSKGAQEYMARGTGDVVLNLGSAFKAGPNTGAR